MANTNFIDDVEKLAAGKIRCLCGNSDWHQFLYAGTPEHLMAGCKTCAKVCTLKDGEWRPA